MELTQLDDKKQQDLDHITVLIADDDPPTRVLLRAAISQWGYKVVEAPDGEAAWEILQKENMPRLLILDWMMPKLDGVELAMRIKQKMSTRPYIILLTHMTGTANIVKGLEAGADEFLSKPFNMAELRSRLSVGARIIRYESELAEELKQIEKLSTLIAELSQHADELIGASKDLDTTQATNPTQLKIQTLKANIQNISNVIKNLRPTMNERKR